MPLTFVEYLEAPPTHWFNAACKGPDGAMWFVAGAASQFTFGTGVARVDPNSFAVTFFPVLTSGGPTSDGVLPYTLLSLGGFLWCTHVDGSGNVVLCRVTTAGVVTSFSIGTTTDYNFIGQGIVGPDGNFWFIGTNGHFLCRVTPAGVGTAFSLGINGLTAVATDGASIWVLRNSAASGLLQCSTAGAVLNSYTLPFSPLGGAGGGAFTYGAGNFYALDRNVLSPVKAWVIPAGSPGSAVSYSGANTVLGTAVGSGWDGTNAWFTVETDEVLQVSATGIVAEYVLDSPNGVPAFDTADLPWLGGWNTQGAWWTPAVAPKIVTVV